MPNEMSLRLVLAKVCPACAVYATCVCARAHVHVHIVCVYCVRRVHVHMCVRVCTACALCACVACVCACAACACVVCVRVHLCSVRVRTHAHCGARVFPGLACVAVSWCGCRPLVLAAWRGACAGVFGLARWAWLEGTCPFPQG